MSDQLLPDFDGPRDDPAPVGPKKPRPRPQRKRPAKKKAKRISDQFGNAARSAGAHQRKPAKRVPKKRRVRKIDKRPALTMPYGGGEPGDALTHGHMKDLWAALVIFKKYTPAMRNRLFEELSKVLA